MSDNGTALAVASAPPPARTAGYSLDEMVRISRALAASGYFSTVRSPEQAFAKILYGSELGIGPMAALQGVHIVDGKPTLDATLVAARIKQSGRYNYRILRTDHEGCEIEFFENGTSLGISSFLKSDAERANLLGKTNWKTYPRDMYRSRAMTRGARSFTPDVFNGAVYTPEELGDGTAVETINVTPEAVPQSEPQDATLPSDDSQVVAPAEAASGSSSSGEAAASQPVGIPERMRKSIEQVINRTGITEEALIEMVGDISSALVSDENPVTYTWTSLSVAGANELLKRLQKLKVPA